jgi:hypothetical protein
MTRQTVLREQADRANYEAVQGGKDGAIRWFLAGVIVFGTAQLVWPPYQRLAIPFKVPLPLSFGNNNVTTTLTDRVFCYAQVPLIPRRLGTDN